MKVSTIFSALGEKKLGSIACPEPWKHGSRSTVGASGRKLGENKALSSKKAKFQPYAKFEKCRICKQPIHQVGSHYCQGTGTMLVFACIMLCSFPLMFGICT
jgi:hypothetical protein